jgi:hypothetical protein
MITSVSFAQYEKRTIGAIKRRAAYAIKTRSFKLVACALGDFMRFNFARFLVVDSFGTIQFCWTLSQALAWLPLCAADFVMVVDTLDNSTVAQRRHN